MVSRTKLLKILNKFKGKKVLILGDIILDHYIRGEVDRISPEAPVPVVWIKKEDYFLGGSSNVANNIKALGAVPVLCGVVGDDIYGRVLKDIIKDKKISLDAVFTLKHRPTTIKTRVIAHHQQVVRIDKEETAHVDGNIRSRIINFLKRNIKSFHAVIIEDYGKGLITPTIIMEVVKLGKKHGKIVVVDPKEEHFDFYRGVNAITPNRKEASAATGIKIRNLKDVELAARILCNNFSIETVLVTLGEEGMLLSQRGQKIAHVPTVAQDVFDVTGAGDTVISCFTLTLAAGGTSLEAANIANYAAGIVVGKVGAYAVNISELKKRIKNV